MAKCKECGQEFTPASGGSGLMPSVPIDTCPECAKAAEAAFHGLLTEATPQIFITPIIIAINLVVFAAMLATGVSFFEPQINQLLKWGADYGPQTLDGEWWRLLSSVFVHIGALHLLLNMLHRPLPATAGRSRLRIGLIYVGAVLILVLVAASARETHESRMSYERGLRFLENNFNDRAIEEFNRAIASAPTFTLAHHELGVAYLRQDSYEQAINAFKKNLELKVERARDSLSQSGAGLLGPLSL